MAGMRVVVVKAADDGSVDLDDLRAQCETHRDDLAAIMVTYPSTHGAYEDTITELCEIVHDARRPGVRRRRQPQRAARLREARRVRWRRLAPQPAQDVLHPARRRWPGRRTGRGARAPRAVPALARDAPRGGQARGDRADQRGAVRLGRDPADLVGLHPADGRRRADQGDRGGGAQRQLRRGPARRALPGALPRPRRPGRARVHPRRARADQGHRRDASTTSRSGSSTTASTRRRCPSRWPARSWSSRPSPRTSARSTGSATR